MINFLRTTEDYTEFGGTLAIDSELDQKPDDWLPALSSHSIASSGHRALEQHQSNDCA